MAFGGVLGFVGGTAKALDLAAASSTLLSIAVDGSLRGNSRADLLLSCAGWRLGQSIKRGDFTAKGDVADWIRTNIAA